MNRDEAAAYCNEHYAGLASIHSRHEQRNAQDACTHFTNEDSINACWIGLTDDKEGGAEGSFRWDDGSAVDFVHWSTGEPNDWSSGPEGGERCTSIEYGSRAPENGHWNDCECSDGMGGGDLIGICQIAPPPVPAPGAPTVWGTGVTSSFNIRVCVDHIDT